VDKKIKAKVMDKTSYNNWTTETSKKSIRSKSSGKFSKNHIERSCLYRTKPLLRLNKDFHPKSGLKNSQTESNDCPAYLNNSNYEHLRPKNTRQLKRKLEA